MTLCTEKGVLTRRNVDDDVRVNVTDVLLRSYIWMSYVFSTRRQLFTTKYHLCSFLLSCFKYGSFSSARFQYTLSLKVKLHFEIQFKYFIKPHLFEILI